MTEIAFLFPGQGSQSVGMGRAFFEEFSLAREIFQQADDVLGFKLSGLCFDGPENDLKLTKNTQPALLTVSLVAFCALGINPVIAAGHSLGEYSALVASGSLKFEEAVLLVHKRGQYMQEAVPVGEGSMAAVMGAEYSEVEKALSQVEKGVVRIANWNSREQIVIAGNKLSVEEALIHLSGSRSVMLPVSAPFHCDLMKKAEEQLAYDLKYVEFRDLKFPIITNVDAKIITRGEEARDALRRQVSRSVLWYPSMQLMEKEGIRLLVELGSGKVLSGLMKRISREWPEKPEIYHAEDPESLEKVRSALQKL
ncbi:MAG: ACP S-malonyltransferase [Candidatus Aminicenantes bacterium]|nr:ACP S-malonyltransferase [Candidatus Aminicenantes bacterium]